MIRYSACQFFVRMKRGSASTPRTGSSSGKRCSYDLSRSGRPSAFALMPESTDHIEHEGKHSTEQNGSCEWEVKGRVLSAVENVPGKTAHGKTGASKEQEKGA